MNAVLAPSDAALVVEQNLQEVFSQLAYLPGARKLGIPGVTGIVTPIPDRSFNGVWGAQFPAAEADDLIARCVDCFGGNNLQMRWIVGPSSQPSDLGARLAEHGFTLISDWQGMTLDLQRLRPASAPAGVSIEEVTGGRGLEQWTAAYAACLSLADHVRDGLRDAFRALPPLTDRRYYVGFLDGEPVATTVLAPAASVAGIHWVATAPQARRRGIAGALVSRALSDAGVAGFGRAVLHSTPAAVGVYQGLGFEPVCRLSSYVFPFFDETGRRTL